MDWAQIQLNALTGKRLTALSDLSAVLILSLSGSYRPRYKWNVLGEKVNDAEWNEIEHAISQMEDEIMKGLIGAIIPHVMADLGDFEALNCDGSTYLRVDYPELYAVIDPALIIDADSFKVPDLVGNFPLGKRPSDDIGDIGGSETHVLTVAEMPSHSHTNSPHNHSEITALPSLADLGTGVPVPSATPSVGITGFSSVVIDASGGGEGHNNMPPYFVISWLIIAR